ncbi:UNVERIFIED_CONTAM: hypothetical protein H355_013142 [Colinus virginianus]|nr:hypothetical protein H355_013142 [Colinus virginianus]
MAVVHVCLLCHYMPPFFLALGGVIAYISSSSSASSPASCHSESSDSGFQSSSSPVPSSPNSSSSESGCNGRSSEGSDGAPKSDRLEEAVKPSQSGVAGLTKGHNGVTKFNGMVLLCKVCGDVASGFHYGVHACEGCKEFESMSPNCHYNDESKDWLTFCFSSFVAVRFGRIPKREKQRMLIEMQSAMKTMMNSQFSSHLPNEALAEHQDQAPQEDLSSKPKQEREALKSPSPPPGSDMAKEEVIGMVTRAHKDTFMYNQEHSQNPAEMMQSQSGERMSKNTEQYMLSSEHCVSGLSGPQYPDSEQHLGGQYKGRSTMHYPSGHAICFTNGHCMNFTNGYTQRLCDRIPEDVFSPNRNTTYSCSTGGRMHLVCPMSKTPHVDPNKSGHEVWEEFSLSFTPAVKEVVEFAKRIPGFRDLSQHDQVNLLKAGTFEVLMVRFASLFDARERTVTFLSGKKYSVDDLHSMGAGDLLNSMFEFSEKLNALQLSDEEMSLFTAVVLVSADRSGIENVNSVEALQETLIRALRTLIMKNHPNEASIFTKLLLKLPDLRSLNNMHSEELLAFKVHP